MIPRAPSPEEIAKAMKPDGGWTREHLAAWGVPWPPPHGWKRRLERRHAWENRKPMRRANAGLLARFAKFGETQ